MVKNNFEERLKALQTSFAPLVPCSRDDKWLKMDFTANNTDLDPAVVNNTDEFINWVNKQLRDAGARYGIGGYAEDRFIYSRSRVFDAQDGAEPRRIHLGVDIWGAPYTRVMAPLDGIVHSFAFNNAYGDYGATIILSHRLEEFSFHTLYGHLSLNSLSNLQEGDVIRKGEVFAGFGIPFENGHWPPHLHFQVILDMQGKKGDYPGVCAASELSFYLSNCPDPNLLLNLCAP